MPNKLITDTYKRAKKTSGSKKAKQIKDEINEDTSGQSNKDDPMYILKQFDLNLKYGPSAGITRMERWNRAQKHGLEPPSIVPDLIDDHKDDKVYTECTWYDYDL